MNLSTWKSKEDKKFITYKNLLSVSTIDSNDPFYLLPINGSGVIGKYQFLTDMKKSFPSIPLRKTVIEKLNKANYELQKINSGYQILVTYGYRSLNIQKKYFNYEINKLTSINKIKNRYSEDVYEEIHRKIAVPEVAGHPTGGAIDVTLFNMKDNVCVPFGSKIYDLKPRAAYFNSPFMKDKYRKNRILLRTLLMKQGFAPYDGEWWHFSYGDREWSYYFKKKNAIYNQVTPQQVKISLNSATNGYRL